jgi:hypothetical protein
VEDFEALEDELESVEVVARWSSAEVRVGVGWALVLVAGDVWAG